MANGVLLSYARRRRCLARSCGGRGGAMSGDVFSKFAEALSGTDTSDPIEPVKLPGDELAHDQPIEWWYFTGHLEEKNGPRTFAFEMTAVRLGFERVEILDYAYFAFIEVSGGRYLSADR